MESPFMRLTEAVPYKICSPQYNAFDFGLLLPTYLMYKDSQMYITQDTPGPVPHVLIVGSGTRRPCQHPDCSFQSWCSETGLCSHKRCPRSDLHHIPCTLSKVRLEPHCGHSDCPSLLVCRKETPLWTMAVAESSQSGQVSEPSRIRDSSILFLEKGVPVGIVTAEYSAMDAIELEVVYLRRRSFLSSVPLSGDAPSLLLRGPNANPPCRHDFCVGWSWCRSDGKCTHPDCDHTVRCKLPKPRDSSHCLHPRCPSLLRCQGGRPVATTGSVESVGRMTTQSMQARELSDVAILPSLETAPLSPVDSSLESSKDGARDSDLDGTFMDIISGQSAGVSTGQGSSSSTAAKDTGMASSSASAVLVTSSSADSPGSVEQDADDEEVERLILNRKRISTEQSAGEIEGGIDPFVSAVRLDKHSCDLGSSNSADVPVVDADGVRGLSGFGEGSADVSTVIGSPVVGKRKADELDEAAFAGDVSNCDNGDDNRVADVGARPVALPVKRRLMDTLRQLGREHQEDVEIQAEQFIAFHGRRQPGNIPARYCERLRSSSQMDLDSRIDTLEREILYCMDLYHTVRESEELSGCPRLLDRSRPWFAMGDDGRPSKRRAL
ncbi:hypothetical protein B0O80DRAFT_433292 [Mortierella sp. GBAus27b]|nr:hypothetical protein B0O80DRAFT_433292 [Mortierella sp. GBAus27b]